MTAGQLRLVPGRDRRPIGAHERAAERVLTRWRAAGHDVDELTSSTLRGAAAAADRARADHDDERASAFAYSRCVLALWQLYRDAAPDHERIEPDELDLPDDVDLGDDGAP